MSNLLKSKEKVIKKQLSIEVCPVQKMFKFNEIWAEFLFHDVATRFHPAFVKFEI